MSLQVLLTSFYRLHELIDRVCFEVDRHFLMPVLDLG